MVSCLKKKLLNWDRLPAKRWAGDQSEAYKKMLGGRKGAPPRNLSFNEKKRDVSDYCACRKNNK